MTLERFSAMASALNQLMPQKPPRTFLGMSEMQWRVWEVRALRHRNRTPPWEEQRWAALDRIVTVMRFCAVRAALGWDQQPIEERARAAA